MRQDLEPASTEEQLKQQDTSEQRPASNSDQTAAPEPQAESKEPQETTDTVGAQTNPENNSDPARTDAPTNGTDAHGQPDAHHDDGGEVVEDNEDTVIY